MSSNEEMHNQQPEALDTSLDNTPVDTSTMEVKPRKDLRALLGFKMEERQHKGLRALIDLIKELIAKIQEWYFIKHYDLTAEDKIMKYQEENDLLKRQIDNAMKQKKPTQPELAKAVLNAMSQMDLSNAGPREIIKMLKAQHPEFALHGVNELIDIVATATDAAKQETFRTLNRNAQQWVSECIENIPGDIQDAHKAELVQQELFSRLQKYQQTPMGANHESGVNSEYLEYFVNAIEKALEAKGVVELSPEFKQMTREMIKARQRHEQTADERILNQTIQQAAADINQIWNQPLTATQEQTQTGGVQFLTPEEAKLDQIQDYITHKFYEQDLHTADLMTVVEMTKRLEQKIVPECRDILNEAAFYAEKVALAEDLYDIDNTAATEQDARVQASYLLSMAVKVDPSFKSPEVLREIGELLADPDADIAGVYKDGKIPMCLHIADGLETQQNIVTTLHQYLNSCQETDPEDIAETQNSIAHINDLCQSCLAHGITPNELKAFIMSVAADRDAHFANSPELTDPEMDVIQFEQEATPTYQKLTEELLSGLPSMQDYMNNIEMQPNTPQKSNEDLSR